MKILITGGTGVIGEGVIPELLKRGHAVRLLSRHADSEVQQWPDGVEPFVADVSDASSLSGSSDGCDAIIHIAGIVAEQPPEITFEKVNVSGTGHVIAEALRSGVRRLIHVSSLGAESGASDYHRSKRAAELLVEKSGLDWTVVRPGNVYGPGDEVLSLLLQMVRVLPAIPVVDRGDQPFQPIWFRDLGIALAALLDQPEWNGETVELAGAEVTSMRNVVERLATVTGRTPLQLPVPGILAQAAATVGTALGLDLPFDENKFTMLVEGNVVRGVNSLPPLLGAEKPTSLEEGLRQLADVQPENLPADGVGRLRRKRFRVEIEQSTYKRQELFERFRNEFGEVMPIDVHVEEDAPKRIAEGVTLSMKLPLRGNIQVRVEKVTTSTIVLATLKGHPIAGIVQFDFTSHENHIIFEITVTDRSGSFLDFFAMETVGKVMQERNWIGVADKVVEMSGGKAPRGVEVEEQELSEQEARKAETWAEELVSSHRKRSHEQELREATR